MSIITVSICCLTYNHEHYIRQCLDGFLMQKTDFSFEILIHDDASTDRTAAIIREYEEKFPTIVKPIYQTENQFSKGVKPTLKFNFPRAKGAYIAMCEGDDYWTDPLKLQKQVDFLNMNPDYVVTYHDFKGDYSAQATSAKLTLTESDKADCTTEELMLCQIWIKTLTMCFRNVLKDIPKELLLVKNADVFLLSLLGNYGKGKWMGTEIAPGVYREHPGGIWSSINTQQRNMDLVTTQYWISMYYNRMGKIEISKMWFSKLIRQLDKMEKEAYNLEENLFGRYKKQTEHLNMIKNSVPYKIGNLITSPFRFLKTVFK